jgi:xylose dehydrogenase (NAD/NADP)
MVCRWGILGPGFVARRAMLPALRACENAQVLAVASRDPDRAATTAAQFGIERVYSDYQTLLVDADIDSVYIALPNHLHCEWTVRAAQAGKHVLCEKPLALNPAECDTMIAACQQAGVLLMEAAMYRFHPRMQALKSLLDAGEIGDVRCLHAAFSFPFAAPDNYRSFPGYGGGVLLDVGSYCINAACWFMPGVPQSAQAYISYSRDIDIDMDVNALLRFTSRRNASQDTLEESIAHIECSFAAAEHQVLEIVGSNGAITAPLAFTAWKDDATMLVLQHGTSFAQRNFAPADPYQLMAEHFMNCMSRKEELRYPPSIGRETLRVVEIVRNAGRLQN